MNSRTLLITSLSILTLFLLGCLPNSDPLLLYQPEGPVMNNSYLLHDVKSKEAALIDVTGPLNIISAYIQENGLELKYIFFTHGHWDHVIGIQNMLEHYPEAKLCYSHREYVAMQVYKDWFEENIYEIESLAVFRAPFAQKHMEFDLTTIKEPDIDVDENQIFHIGNTQITAILTPGHSPGSVCYYTEKAVFTGDVLQEGYVGRTDVYGSSWEDQVESVRSLYDMFSDDTKVYPGHFGFTDIGTEKKHNKNITENEIIGPFEVVSSN